MPDGPSLTQPVQESGFWKGFPLSQLERFGIKRNSQGVWIPYYKRDRTLFRAKLFADNGRSWWLGGQGKGQIPYGLEQLGNQRTDAKALVLTEGESDTLALRLAWPDSIVAIGIPGASSWKSEWKCLADGFERVYLSFDGDQAGARAAEKVAKDLPQAKVLHLPDGADTRDVIQRLGKRAYRALIDSAEAELLFNRAVKAKYQVHDAFQKRAA